MRHHQSDSHTTTPLDSAPDLFTLSPPSSLQPQPAHLVFCNPSEPCVTVNILVHSSPFPFLSLLFGSPVLSLTHSPSGDLQHKARVPQGYLPGARQTI